jgi:hypothetical protein
MRNRSESAFVYLLAAVGMTAVLVAPVFAQEEEEEPFHVKAISRYVTEADVNDMPGDIQITDSRLNMSYGKTLQNLLPLLFSLNLRHIDINENLTTDLPSHLEGRQLGLGTKFPMPFVDSDVYFMGIDVFPSLYTDDWKWEDSAFRMPFRTYGIYKPNDNFVLVAGVTVRIDYDDEVLPLIGVIYKPNDRLTLNLATDEPNISYKLSRSLTAFAEVDYVLDEYEVTRNGQEGVVLKYREFSTGAGFQYAPNRFLEASISAGGVINRRLEYEDGIGKIEPDAAPYVKARMAFKF